MCGIAGAIAEFSSGPSAEQRVWRIVDSQKDRGPDAQAVESIASGVNVVVLGHSRLSIIDLSVDANQPMWDQSGRFCLVYNGEIYNYLELRSELLACGHSFRTTSDSEVLIESYKRWGRAAVTRFNGMFAFALLDTQNRQLLLGRDRFGVKPLYYVSRRREFVFASTPSAMATDFDCGPDVSYLARGVQHQLFEDDSDGTQYEGIHAVRPGELMAVSWDEVGELETRRQQYYDFETEVLNRREQIVGARESDLVDEMFGRLSRAVTLRLRADVPVGISLSGGLDSSSVAALVAEQHQRVHGFTFGSPDVRRSEGESVRRVAADTDVQMHFVWPDPEAFIQRYFHAIDSQDAPFTGLSVVAQDLLFQEARRAGVVVLLGGQGADELLMGYRKFYIFVLKEYLAKRRFGLALEHLAWFGVALLAEAPQAPLYLRHIPRYLRRHGLESCLNLPRSEGVAAGFTQSESAWRRQVADVLRCSLPTMLRYEDRNSMGNSVESRLPFLDYRFAEAACALPEALKIRRGHGKWALRAAMQGRVPDRVRLARRKNGFDPLEEYWIRNGLGAALREALRARWPKVRRWVPADSSVEALFSDDRLVGRVQTGVEATTLLWLAKRWAD
jgi:asparagine synthase (glutamine-hydrolysing)